MSSGPSQRKNSTEIESAFYHAVADEPEAVGYHPGDSDARPCLCADGELELAGDEILLELCDNPDGGGGVDVEHQRLAPCDGLHLELFLRADDALEEGNAQVDRLPDDWQLPWRACHAPAE